MDGIVCVGGDGTLSEVINGVIMHSARENSVNLNKSQVEIPFPNIRIGIIPAGSTDTVAYTLHGHLDILTCAFHIVAGNVYAVFFFSLNVQYFNCKTRFLL